MKEEAPFNQISDTSLYQSISKKIDQKAAAESLGTIAVAIFWLVMSCIMKKYNKSNDVDRVEKLAKDLNYLVSIPCLVAFIIIFFMFLAV